MLEKFLLNGLEDSPNGSEDSLNGLEYSPNEQDPPAIAVTEETPTVYITEETPADAVLEKTPADMDSEERGNPAPNLTTPDDNFIKIVQQIFYRNQYTDAYRINESVIKKTVYRNFHCINRIDKLQLTIYCKSPTVLNTSNQE